MTESHWQTSITEAGPNLIRHRGYDIAELLERSTFAEVAWLMLRGELPTPGQLRLFDALLVSGVDHGPLAPSIAVARMTMTCGVSITSAMASGVNALGDVHGGAGQQLLQLMLDIRDRQAHRNLAEVVREVVEEYRTSKTRVPGFGHPLHRKDPRCAPLLNLAEEALRSGEIDGWFLEAVKEIEGQLGTVPLNVDGAAAAVCGALGFTPVLARGLFALSRTVGILAHANEELLAGTTLKSSASPSERPEYTGPDHRPFPSPTTMSDEKDEQ